MFCLGGTRVRAKNTLPFLFLYPSTLLSCYRSVATLISHYHSVSEFENFFGWKFPGYFGKPDSWKFPEYFGKLPIADSWKFPGPFEKPNSWKFPGPFGKPSEKHVKGRFLRYFCKKTRGQDSLPLILFVGSVIISVKGSHSL
jgi:hypothetical protein